MQTAPHITAERGLFTPRQVSTGGTVASGAECSLEPVVRGALGRLDQSELSGAQDVGDAPLHRGPVLPGEGVDLG